MTKALLITLALSLGLAQTSYAEDRTVEETVESTRTDEGSVPTTQDTRSVSRTEERRSGLSKGGLFLEPILTATQEDSTIRSSQLPLINSDTSGNVKGYGAGLRFGGHISEIIFLGADARYSKLKMDDSFYNKADTDVYNVGPMIGFQTPLFGLRIMGTYVLAGENNPGASNNGIDLKFKEASGLRYGAGLFIAAISINLEYQDLTYNTTEIQSLGSVASNTNTSVDANSRGYTVSLSFPIEL